MAIVGFVNKLSKEQQQQVRDLAYSCRDEFIPSLDVRYSTKQHNLLFQTKSDQYFDELVSQHFVLAYVQSEVVGFLSFRDENFYDGKPCLYITTVCVMPMFRKQGIASNMLSLINGERGIARTWSSNTEMINILTKRGYIPIWIIKDDRGYNIDTVYFQKKL